MFRSKKSRNAANSASDQPSETSGANSDNSNQLSQNVNTEEGNDDTHTSRGNEAPRGGGSSRNRGKRKRCVVPINANSSSEESRDWTDEVNFDEREDVRAIDAEGNVQVWSGSIQTHDVWFLKEGVRFEVCFNRYCQPIRKGGSVLVKFVADIAKKDEICPIKDINWRKVNAGVQADIVELIRGKFKIPDGKIYNDAMLKHVGKHRRQWKFDLKAKYFKPTMRTRTQIENDRPGGIVRPNWLELVDYWYSSKSQKYSKNGKEARALLGHLHTNGATSFANSRDEFEAVHGREPGGFEFFVQTYKAKEGAYPDNTNTEEFIHTAKSKIDESVANSSSSKPRLEIENEVFDELMYDKEKVNQRPLGYGFGVKRNEVMGVHALLRKRGFSSDSSSRENQNLQVEFTRHKKQTTNLVMRLASQMSDLLSAVENGRVSPEVLAATNSALRSLTTQNVETPREENEENEDTDESDHEM